MWRERGRLNNPPTGAPRRLIIFSPLGVVPAPLARLLQPSSPYALDGNFTFDSITDRSNLQAWGRASRRILLNLGHRGARRRSPTRRAH